MVHDESKSCSGRCKAVVRKIVEEVRAEAEQWSQMQEMLAQVRGEMEELRASRDFWENRAYDADHEIQCLGHAMDVWKVKALEYKNKANELQLELSILKEETQKSKPDSLPPFPLVKQLKKEKLLSNFRLKKTRHINEEGRNKFENAVEELNAEVRTPKEELTPLSLGKQLEKEKRMLLVRLKENKHQGNEKVGKLQELSGSADGRRKKTYSISEWSSDPKHSSLTDIESLSPFARQRSRSAFGFCSPESSRMRNSFKINK